MIITVTPNVSIDKTYVVPGYSINKVHRPEEAITTAGGKGINVARVLKRLSNDVVATGFLGGETGKSILKYLHLEEIDNDFVKVNEESRLCITVVDPDNISQTEVNENGPDITADEVSSIYNKIFDLLDEAEYIVLCGSCPPGVPEDFYSNIINIAKRKSVKVVLDSSGEQLRNAVKSSPFMVKPNIHELSHITGFKIHSVDKALEAAKKIIKDYEISVVAVTMGKDGAIVTDGTNSWKSDVPEIEFASALGSGDSFAAAFIDTLSKGGTIERALIAGNAAGAANAEELGAAFFEIGRMKELMNQISIDRIT